MQSVGVGTAFIIMVLAMHRLCANKSLRQCLHHKQSFSQKTNRCLAAMRDTTMKVTIARWPYFVQSPVGGSDNT